MIAIKDSARLAFTKFKQRKIRTLISGCSVSLGAIVLIASIMAFKGVNNVLNKIYRYSLSGNKYVVESLDGYQENVNKDKYMNKYSNYDIKNVYIKNEIKSNRSYIDYSSEYYNSYSEYDKSDIDTSGFTLDFSKQWINGQDMYSLSDLTATDKIFLNDLVYQDYDITKEYNGAIPVIVPISMVMQNESMNSKKVTDDYVSYDRPTIKKQVEIYKKELEDTKSTLNKYLGRNYSLMTFDEASINSSGTSVKVKETNIDVIIVGFYSTSFDGGWDSSIYISNNIFEIGKVKSLFENDENTNTSLIYQVSESGYNKIVKNYNSTLTPVIDPYAMYREPLKYLKYVLYGFGGFFLFISFLITFFTVNKIVVESKREIGIFRAVGATKWDVNSLFLIYSLIITNFGFVIGTIIAVIFDFILSILYGNITYYSMAIMGNNFDHTKPWFVFIGIDILPLLLIYLLSNLSGVLASALPALRASRMDVVKAIRDE